MLNRNNVAKQIADLIITSIVEGKLKTGDQLPNERALAMEYGVSRVPLREALSSLRQMGVIVTKHGIGTFINDVNATFLMNQLSAYLFLQEKPVIEVIQLRRLIEVESARLAAIHITDEELEKLKVAEIYAREELFKLREGADNSFNAADLQFHRAIAEASHNSLFVQFLESIHGTLHIHQVLSQKEPQPIDDVAKYHRKVVEAIQERDSGKSAQMMLNHINRIEELILRAFSKKKELKLAPEVFIG
jgi:GntR family transcriptional regulator, transcriptional repressor for pyruvate dehydrogenase complex